MNKKFAICKVYSCMGQPIMIFSYDEYCTAMCQLEILHESDDYNEIVSIFKEKYDNTYISERWLIENGYKKEAVQTFSGTCHKFTKNTEDVIIEITLQENKDGIHILFNRPRQRSLEFFDNDNKMRVEKFNKLLDLF